MGDDAWDGDGFGDFDDPFDEENSEEEEEE